MCYDFSQTCDMAEKIWAVPIGSNQMQCIFEVPIFCGIKHTDWNTRICQIFINPLKIGNIIFSGAKLSVHIFGLALGPLNSTPSVNYGGP
jgi:hypothetical protein